MICALDNAHYVEFCAELAYCETVSCLQFCESFWTVVRCVCSLLSVSELLSFIGQIMPCGKQMCGNCSANTKALNNEPLNLKFSYLLVTGISISSSTEAYILCLDQVYHTVAKKNTLACTVAKLLHTVVQSS